MQEIDLLVSDFMSRNCKVDNTPSSPESNINGDVEKPDDSDTLTQGIHPEADPFKGKQLFLQPDRTDSCECGTVRDTESDKSAARARKDTPLARLEAMTGIDEVKAEVKRQLCYRRVMKMRKAMGVEIPRRLPHMLLTGNPGTGKTTVARLIAGIFANEGILRSETFIETNRASLVGRYIGDTEKNVMAKIEEAYGGVLFIDEMYSLVADDSDTKDYGHRVIETLMPVLSNENAEIMVIGAGYPDSIRKMLSSNPGLTSRFPTVINFEDFSDVELLDIALKRFAKFGFDISPQAEQRLREVISRLRRRRHFGNARDIVTMIENHIIPNFCMRVEADYNSADDNFLNVILPADIPDVGTMFPLSASRTEIGFKLYQR